MMHSRVVFGVRLGEESRHACDCCCEVDELAENLAGSLHPSFRCTVRFLGATAWLRYGQIELGQRDCGVDVQRGFLWAGVFLLLGARSYFRFPVCVAFLVAPILGYSMVSAECRERTSDVVGFLSGDRGGLDKTHPRRSFDRCAHRLFTPTRGDI